MNRIFRQGAKAGIIILFFAWVIGACADSDLFDDSEGETKETAFLKSFDFDGATLSYDSVPSGSGGFYSPQISETFYPERLTPGQPFELAIVSDFVFSDRITHVLIAVQGADGLLDVPVEPRPYDDGQVWLPLSGLFSKGGAFSKQLYFVQFFLMTNNHRIGLPSKWYVSVADPPEAEEVDNIELCRRLCMRESECRTDLDELDGLTCLQGCGHLAGGGKVPNDDEIECLEREGCPAYLACMNRIELE